MRVLTARTTKKGAPKLLERLPLPAVGRNAVDRVYTNLAVLEPAGDHFRIIELAIGVSVDDVVAETGVKVPEWVGVRLRRRCTDCQIPSDLLLVGHS